MAGKFTSTRAVRTFSLPRGAQVDARPKGEPVRAGPVSVTFPSTPCVEVGDQHEHPVRGRVDVGGQHGDLVAERLDSIVFIERGGRVQRGDLVERMCRHERGDPVQRGGRPERGGDLAVGSGRLLPDDGPSGGGPPAQRQVAVTGSGGTSGSGGTNGIGGTAGRGRPTRANRTRCWNPKHGEASFSDDTEDTPKYKPGSGGSLT